MVGVGGSSPLAPTKRRRSPVRRGFFICIASARVDSHHRPFGSGLAGPSMDRPLRFAPGSAASRLRARPHPAVLSSPLAPTKRRRSPVRRGFFICIASARVDSHHRPFGSGLAGPSMDRPLRFAPGSAASRLRARPHPAVLSSPLAPTNKSRKNSQLARTPHRASCCVCVKSPSLRRGGFFGRSGHAAARSFVVSHPIQASQTVLGMTRAPER